MKIVGQQPNPLPETAASRDTAAAQQRRDEAKPTAAEESRVELSPLARALAGLRSELGDVEASDPARVAELKSAVQGGTYDPPASEVADALLRELAANRIV